MEQQVAWDKMGSMVYMINFKIFGKRVQVVENGHNLIVGRSLLWLEKLGVNVEGGVHFHLCPLVFRKAPQTSLVVQKIGICQSMQETRVWFRRIPHATGQLSPGAPTTEPVLQSLHATTPKPAVLQILKPQRLEPMLLNKRSPRNEKPCTR